MLINNQLFILFTALQVARDTMLVLLKCHRHISSHRGATVCVRHTTNRCSLGYMFSVHSYVNRKASDFPALDFLQVLQLEKRKVAVLLPDITNDCA